MTEADTVVCTIESCRFAGKWLELWFVEDHVRESYSFDWCCKSGDFNEAVDNAKLFDYMWMYGPIGMRVRLRKEKHGWRLVRALPPDIHNVPVPGRHEFEEAWSTLCSQVEVSTGAEEKVRAFIDVLLAERVRLLQERSAPASLESVSNWRLSEGDEPGVIVAVNDVLGLTIQARTPHELSESVADAMEGLAECLKEDLDALNERHNKEKSIDASNEEAASARVEEAEAKAAAAEAKAEQAVADLQRMRAQVRSLLAQSEEQER